MEGRSTGRRELFPSRSPFGPGDSPIDHCTIALLPGFDVIMFWYGGGGGGMWEGDDTKPSSTASALIRIWISGAFLGQSIQLGAQNLRHPFSTRRPSDAGLSFSSWSFKRAIIIVHCFSPWRWELCLNGKSGACVKNTVGFAVAARFNNMTVRYFLLRFRCGEFVGCATDFFSRCGKRLKRQCKQHHGEMMHDAYSHPTRSPFT